jgi:pimeloyl-ACP methyl ester carboxylesterase
MDVLVYADSDHVSACTTQAGSVPPASRVMRACKRLQRGRAWTCLSVLEDAPGEGRARPEVGKNRAGGRPLERAVAAGGEAGCNPFAAHSGPERAEFVARNMFPDNAVRAELERADAAGGLRNTGEMGKALFSQGLLEYRFAAHKRLTMPALVIAGERDFQIGLEPQRELARRLRHAELLVYENAGHFMYLDAPDRFTRDVVAFLDRSRSTR